MYVKLTQLNIQDRKGEVFHDFFNHDDQILTFHK